MSIPDSKSAGSAPGEVPTGEKFSLGQLATLACLQEVIAPKPGNVHRGADFNDVTLDDFVVSAVVFGGAIDRAANASLGQLILESISATRSHVASNTNLGLVLLIAPLVLAARRNQTLSMESVQSVLDQLTPADSLDTYRAIQIAQPGGMGAVEDYDLRAAPPEDLIAAMHAARDRDRVARQYANGFDEVFEVVGPTLRRWQNRLPRLSDAIVMTHIELMSRWPDSLIVRKSGAEAGNYASMLAQKAIDAYQMDVPHNEQSRFWNLVSDLDLWLRSDGNGRNPGTTADLIGAGLFAAMFNGEIPVKGVHNG